MSGTMTGRRITASEAGPDRWSDAPCRRYPYLPWTPDDRPTHTMILAMEDVCRACPVIAACADYALNGQGGAGVDGGFYAGTWIPWKTVDGQERRREARRIARIVLRNTLRRTASQST